jgi:hypothetical protein
MAWLQVLSDLLWKLRRIERSVPDDIREDGNFLGLRVDESGRFVSIGRLFDSPVAKEADVIARLERLPAFVDALNDAELMLTRDGDDATNVRFHKCYAGDGAYPARCSDHCFTANRRAAGTLGWFCYLDGVPVAVASYHVFCPSGDRTPLHSTCAYWWAYNGAADQDYRIGSLWNYDRADDARKRLFDCALIRIDDVSLLSGALAACDNGLQRPYPGRLADENAIADGETFYMIGMKTRSAAATRFKGVGSRKLGDAGRTNMYYEQLFFERCSVPGDSGAVIVHEKTNAIAGQTLAADGLFTIASPLYRKPWRHVGFRTVGAVTLPDLRYA